MNKRQQKKRQKIIQQRFNFFNGFLIRTGRKNGKTLLFKAILKACYSKKHKPFKYWVKKLEELNKYYLNRYEKRLIKGTATVLPKGILRSNGYSPSVLIVDEFKN